MADSLCGPSNALQSFQKHTAVDRTLQQDRLVGRQHQSEGFRTISGHASAADLEFEAFQNGHNPLVHPEPHLSYAQQHHGPFSPVQQPMQAGPTSWTADFQRMNISGQTPHLQQPAFHSQQQPQAGMGSWSQDYGLQKQKQAAGPAFTQSSFSNTQSSYMPTNYQMPISGGPTTNVQVQAASAEQEFAFDEDAFARAFEAAEQAERDLIEEDLGKGKEAVASDHQTAPENLQETIPRDEDIQQQARLGADLIHDPRTGKDELRDEREDPDALARTAGNLLERLQDNHTDKFQNSQFLNLMRQLRDKQLIVEGDKFVSPQANADIDANNSRQDEVAPPY